VIVKDRVTGSVDRVSVGPGGVQANGNSISASISDSGQVAAFQTTATNLGVTDSNGQPDTFVRNRATGQTVCASVTPGGATGNAGSYALHADENTGVHRLASNLIAGARRLPTSSGLHGAGQRRSGGTVETTATT
jgi:hypothetical protein